VSVNIEEDECPVETPCGCFDYLCYVCHGKIRATERLCRELALLIADREKRIGELAASRDAALERAEDLTKDRLNAETHADYLVGVIKEWWWAEEACRNHEHPLECADDGFPCPDCNAIRDADERLWAAEDTLRAIAEEG
jgi:hypothetical protein